MFITVQLRAWLFVLWLVPSAALGICFTQAFTLYAARPVENKLDADLRALYRQRTRSTSESAEQPARIRQDKARNTVGVIIKLNEESETVTRELAAHGVQLRARVGDLAVAEVAVTDLPQIAALPSIKHLRAAKYKTLLGTTSHPTYFSRAFNDTANAVIKAPNARTLYNVTGRGVIVGLIDSGIDWRHGDFRQADGKTRIKTLWDMSDGARTGPNGVGRVYTEAELNSALQNNGSVNERDFNGHGTHVAGTAAGNGLGTGNSMPAGTFAGIAPEADLIVVKATRSTNAQATFADDDLIAALSFINDRATSLQQPFVINLSLGGHYSAHDGSDPLEQAIDNLLATGKGKQVVIAAGNEGEDNIHAGGMLAEGSEVVLPFTVTSKADGMIAIYQGTDTVRAKIIKPNGTVVGPVSLFGLITSDPEVELENAPGESVTDPKAVLVTFKRKLAGQWKLVLSGTKINNGRYDVWTQDAGETQLDASVRDGLCSVASPATARRAISVGNFVTKTEYVDVNGTPRIRIQQGPSGQLAVSSSLGPSRDGRLTPLLAAPGSYLASTRSADYTIDSFTGGEILPEFLTNDGGKHYVAFGSSMSAATVTGTVALMLQANPNLNPEQIRRLLTRTVTNDQFTGAAISARFGYGKLNALEAVKAVVENVAAKEFISVSGATFSPETVGAPDTIMAGFGMNLTTATAAATATPLPTVLAGISVRLTDSTGVSQLAPLFYASPTQINYLIPSNTAHGIAQIEVVQSASTVIARGSISINALWPGLFTTGQNGRGLVAADVLRVKANGSQVLEPIHTPIDLSPPGDKVYLQLYGTGLRGRTNLSAVKLTLGGTPLTVEYAGAQPQYTGLDQINALIPTSLTGRNRTLDLVLYVDGWAANVAQCRVK
ncbi:MAG TPA: S8 family serine peptidase [Blastocatellia bacterium]|nr:S8 family serine peptidase [Blastocatellia bacterium]